MESWNFDAVTFDGDVYCNECSPFDLDREGVYPILASSKVDSYPVCSVCGKIHDYMGLTNKGRKQKKTTKKERERDFQAWNFDAVTFDGDVYCNECLPVDLDSEGVYPILASSKVDRYPACAVCGKKHDYMELAKKQKKTKKNPGRFMDALTEKAKSLAGLYTKKQEERDRKISVARKKKEDGKGRNLVEKRCAKIIDKIAKYSKNEIDKIAYQNSKAAEIVGRAYLEVYGDEEFVEKNFHEFGFYSDEFKEMVEMVRQKAMEIMASIYLCEDEYGER